MRLGYDEAVTTISREEMDRTIHPDDIKEIRVLLTRPCRVKKKAHV